MASPPDSRTSPLLLVTCSAVCALITLDTNIVAVSLPSIARSLQAGFSDIEWVVSSYMLAFASLLLPAGGIADLFGRRRTLLVGLGVFAVASLFCGAAWSIEILQWARVMKGVGAALLLTSALAVIGHTYRTEHERTHAWAIWGTCMGVSATMAPLLGGTITQLMGWRWIFLLNLPVCLILGTLVWRHVDESRDVGAARIDFWGGLTFSGGLCCLIWAMIGANLAGWTSTVTLGRAGAGLLLLALFIPVELLQQRPMIDLRLFRAPRFVGAVQSMFGYAASAQVMMTFLPLYLQNAFSYSAISAGLAMLPFALAMMVFPRVGAALTRFMPLHGLMSLALGMVCTGNVMVAIAAAMSSHWLVLAGMIVTGSGAGILNGNTQKAIVRCVPPERSGMVSGISTTTRFAGIVLAIACLGGILVQHTGSRFGDALNAAQITPPSNAGEVVQRAVAGDGLQALQSWPAETRVFAEHALQSGFARAFAAAMLIAALVAAISAVLTYVLGRGEPRELPQPALAAGAGR
ncbi:MFS transporter [Oxalobacteraceae bacterium CAVE-383]|nr:MFS transporter [Oxalobacteraceae bacterium CAVE-383]